MENENLRKRDISISFLAANFYSLISIIPVIIILYFLYSFIWTKPVITFKYPYWLIYLIGAITHELLHGITAMRFSKQGIKSIKFGISWKMLTPYCHCKEPLTVNDYRIVAIAPLVILGILPTIIGLIIGLNDFFVFGLLFIIAAGGDLIIIWKLRNENKNTLALDMPDKCGCLIYEPEESGVEN